MQNKELVLSIDCTSNIASIALHELNTGDLLLIEKSPTFREHLSFIAPRIYHNLHFYGFDKLKKIQVSSGPGSHTGIRAGLSFAQGLYHGLKMQGTVIEIEKISNFAILGNLLLTKEIQHQDNHYFLIDSGNKKYHILPLSEIIQKNYNYTTSNDVILPQGANIWLDRETKLQDNNYIINAIDWHAGHMYRITT